MNCSQLIYASQPFGLDEMTLAAILTSARDHNRRNGITGCLICRRDLYLQMLEGDAEAITATYARILRDPRHVDAKQLWFGEARSRLFAAWDMRQDRARSWMWSRDEIKDGVLQRASGEDVLNIFRRIAAEPPETTPI